MSRPITWQTVRGSDPIEALRGIQVAQQMGSGAFDQFGKIIQGVQATDDANWKQTKDNNTQAFLDKVMSSTSAEQFKAMQDSGELQAMIAANGAQIDRAAARNAMDGRLATLQQRDKQGWEYANAALDEKEAPVSNQVKALLAQGKTKEAMPLIQGLSPRGQASLMTALDARIQEETTRKRSGEKWDLEKNALQWAVTEGRKLEKARLEASTRASNAQAAASSESVNRSKEQRQWEREDRDAGAKNREKLAELARIEASLEGNMYQGGVLTDRDIPEVINSWIETRKAAGKVPNGDEVANVTGKLQKYVAGGFQYKGANGDLVTLPAIPKNRALVALLGSEEGMLLDDGYGSNFDKNLAAAITRKKTAVKSLGPEFLGLRYTADEFEDTAAKDYVDYKAALQGKVVNLVVPPDKKKGK